MAHDAVRVGVIGLGFAGRSHVSAMQIEGFDVVAVAASSREKAQAFASPAGVPAAYGDYRALLEHPGLDAVVVATQTALHHEVIMSAIAAGKHVLCEKPIGLDLHEARDVRDAAAAAGLTGMIAHAYRFSPVRRYVKHLLDEGYVGDVRQVVTTWYAGPRSAPEINADTPRRGPGEMHWRMTKATGGGFLDGAGATFFDSLRDWVGELDGITGRTLEYGPERVQMDGSLATAADADEGFSALFTFANGATGSMTASVASPFGAGGRIDIFGSAGTLQMVQPGLLPGPDTTLFGGNFANGPELTELAVPAAFLIPAHPSDPQPPFMTAYRPLARAFADGIATGTSPSPSFEDAYRDQQITDAILTSTVAGEWVRLGD